MAPFTLPTAPYPNTLFLSLALLVLSEYRAFYYGSALFKVGASLSFFLGGLAQGSPVAQRISSSGFDTQAFRDDARYRFTVLMLAGLAFSVLGDVFLIPTKAQYYSFLGTTKSKGKGKKRSSSAAKAGEGDSALFKLGMLFFALAHLSYIAGFASNPARAPSFGLTPFFLSVLISGAVSTWLGVFTLPGLSSSHLAVPSNMQPLVKGYCVIITAMVATATATANATDAGRQTVLGAWLFMISDMFVAVDTFGNSKKPAAAQKSSSRPGWTFRSVGLLIYFSANLILAGSI